MFAVRPQVHNRARRIGMAVSSVASLEREASGSAKSLTSAQVAKQVKLTEHHRLKSYTNPAQETSSDARR